MSEKIKYDLEFTDRLGNTHRIVKDSEPVEDIEGLQDLIYGFVKLLNISGWECINDLEVITDCDYESIVSYEELIDYISEKTEIDEEIVYKIKEAEMDYFAKNGIIELEEE